MDYTDFNIQSSPILSFDSMADQYSEKGFIEIPKEVALNVCFGVQGPLNWRFTRTRFFPTESVIVLKENLNVLPVQIDMVNLQMQDFEPVTEEYLELLRIRDSYRYGTFQEKDLTEENLRQATIALTNFSEFLTKQFLEMYDLPFMYRRKKVKRVRLNLL